MGDNPREAEMITKSKVYGVDTGQFGNEFANNRDSACPEMRAGNNVMNAARLDVDSDNPGGQDQSVCLSFRILQTSTSHRGELAS
jgi:hypothetical protein